MERHCAHCGKPLIQGQRHYGSHYTEGEARFARRKYCSQICCVKAEKAKRK